MNRPSVVERIPDDLRIFEEFTELWSAAGWGPQVRLHPDNKEYGYSAALFPPSELLRYAKLSRSLFNRFHGLDDACTDFTTGLDSRLQAPVGYLNESRANWAVGRTAFETCVGAIEIATKLYPNEQPPSPAELQNLIDLRKASVTPVATTTSPSYFDVSLASTGLLIPS